MEQATSDMIQFPPFKAEISDRKIYVKEHDSIQPQGVSE